MEIAINKTKAGIRCPKVSVIIPAKNEEKNLPLVLPRIPKIVDELIMVDGLSTDRTDELARELRPDIQIITQNRAGKGNAIQCGLKNATGDFIVMLDADGSMNPEEIPGLIEPLSHGYDMVKGSRFLPGGGTSDMERHRVFGNKLIIFLVNLLFRSRYSDLCYGYLAFRRDVIQRTNIESDGFEIEAELNVKALQAGWKICEVPSFESKRFSGKGNLHSLSDGKRIIKTILKLRFAKTRKLRT